MTLKTFQNHKVVLCPLYQGKYGKERFYVTANTCSRCPESGKERVGHRISCPAFEKTNVAYRTFKDHKVVLCPKWKGASGHERMYASDQNCQFCSWHAGNVLGIRSNCRYEEGHGGSTSKVNQTDYPKTKDIDGDGKIWHFMGAYSSVSEARKVAASIIREGTIQGKKTILARIMSIRLTSVVYSRRKV